MDFNKINNNIKEQIKHELGIDVDITNRQRKNVEARSLYYNIIVELTPSQALRKIGESVNKDHATVIYGIAQYKSFSYYNKELDKIRKKIIEKYRASTNEFKLQSIEDQIEYLQKELANLKAKRLRVMTKINQT